MEPIKIMWRHHTSAENGPVRVWKEGDPFDWFQVLTRTEFETASALLMRLGFVVLQAKDDD